MDLVVYSLLLFLQSAVKGLVVPQAAVVKRRSPVVVLHSMRWNEHVDAQVDVATELPPFPDFATWKFFEGIEKNDQLGPQSLFVTTALVLLTLES